jgi:formamidopyrimidine-DNA glycosylase
VFLSAVPELPEVERAAQMLREAAVGHTITAVRVLHPAYARALPPDDADRIVGSTVTDVTRRGKYQIVLLDSGAALEVHFRMTGEWLVRRSTDSLPPFARLVLDLDGGTRVVLADARALGTARLHLPGTPALPLLGPDPLTPDFTATHLRAMLSRRRGPIKPALLDQRLVAGIGNIYAVEALWLARISPRVRAASLGSVRLERLVQAIRTVLDRAPAARYAERTNRQHVWRVYDRAGHRCRRCGSHIRRITQAGRSTYFCPFCQRR